MACKEIILASGSDARRALLDRLGIPYRQCAPMVDERAYPGESAGALVTRLAMLKAQAVLPHAATALVIAGDQVAELNGDIVGKSGDFPTAMQQLQRASGRTVTFYTGVCVIDATTGSSAVDCVPFEVGFKILHERTIVRYLETEQPYDCAGSFRCEGLGITLFTRLSGTDPTALVGLPLIRLTTMLKSFGYDVVAAAYEARSSNTV